MDRLDRVLIGLGYAAAQGGWDEESTLRDVLAMTALVDACVCNVGCQACPVHSGNLFTIDQRFASERAWDERVARGRSS